MVATMYSIEAAAKRLGGLSPWTVRAWLSQGRIQKTKVGRRTMITEAALEKFLTECAVRASEESKGQRAQ